MIEYLPLVLTGIGIIVSLLYYTSVLRNAENTRRRDQLFLRFQSIDKEWLKAYAYVISTDFEDLEDFIQINNAKTNARALNWYNVERGYD